MIDIETTLPQALEVRNQVINIDTFRPLAEKWEIKIKIVMFKIDVLVLIIELLRFL